MEKFCLKWNAFQENVSKSFSALRKEQDFHDVTLVSDDNEVFSAHKVVLSASSDFFKCILRKADHAKPMIYLNGIMSKELGQILDYIYEGEVQLFQGELDHFLSVAEKLKFDGLTGSEMEPEQTYEAENIAEDVENTNTQKANKTESKVWNEGKYEKTVAVANSTPLGETKQLVDQMIVKDGDSWSCKTCNKTSKSNCHIRKHAEIHIEGLSFPCQICGKIFSTRNALSCHKVSFHKRT